VVYIVGTGAVSSNLLDRFDQENISNASGRIDIWKAGMIAADDYNYVGLGLGQYHYQHLFYIEKLQGEVYFTVTEYSLGLHSEYMTLFVEVGVIGLALYLAAAVTLWIEIRRAGRHDPKFRSYSIIIEGLLFFDLVFGSAQTMYYFPYHWLIWGVCLAFININYHARRRANRVRNIPKRAKKILALS
jgi:O-antigen ligase